MAPRKAAITASKATEIVEEGDVSSAPSDWEWETVSSETSIRVLFDSIGDVFVGQFVGIQTITPEGVDKDGKPNEPFDLYIFTGRDGNSYSINKSWKIETAFDDYDVQADEWVRITYVKDVETKRGLNPMKDFKVEVRRA